MTAKEERRLAQLRMAAMTVEVRKLAASPNGFSVATLKPVQRQKDAYTAAERLVEKGELFKVKISHRVVLFFADKEAAERWTPKPSQGVTIKVQKSGFDPNEPGLITEKTIFTRCPSPSVAHKSQISNWGSSQ